MALTSITKDFITRAGIVVQGTATVSSSTAQLGALQVNAGAAIAKNLIVGQGSTIYGETTVYNTLDVTGAVDFSSTLDVAGNTTVDGTLEVAKELSVNTTTAATSAGAGALTVDGGVFVDKNLIINSTDVSFDTSTKYSNSLYVNGGAWIEKGMMVDGPVTFNSPVVFQGTTTYVLSTNTVYTDNLFDLHINGSDKDTLWTVDDGKDIGWIFHYFKSEDKRAFLGYDNGDDALVWYKNGSESTGTTSTYIPLEFGKFITGQLDIRGIDNAISTTTGAIQTLGGIGVAQDVYVGGKVNAATVNARNLTENRIVLVGASGQLVDSASLTWNTATNKLVGTISTATNLAGGAAGSLPYQTADGVTTMLAIGAANTLLTSVAGAPAWVAPGDLAAGNATTATNIAGGTSNQIPYQTAEGITAFSSGLTFDGTTLSATSLDVSTTATIDGDLYVSGDLYLQGVGSDVIEANTGTFQYLVATGTNVGLAVTNNATIGGTLTATGVTTVANTTNSTSTTTGALIVAGGVGIGQDLRVGGTIYGNVTGNVTGDLTGNADTASQVDTVRQATSATYFVTFVDSNNATAEAESVYTSSTFSLNPATKTVTIDGDLTISGTITGTIEGGAAQVRTVKQTDNANYFLTFVDSNNDTATAETVYTSSTIYYNPSTASLVINGSSTLNGAVTISGATAINNTATIKDAVITGTMAVTGVLTVSNTTDATTKDLGSIVTEGGIGVEKSIVAGGLITAGAVAAATTATVVNGFFSNNTLIASFTSNPLTDTATANLDAWDATTYRTARYIIQVVRGTSVHVTEMTLFHNGTDVYLNEYGISTNAGELGEFDAVKSGNNIVLKFTPNSADSTVVKVTRTTITL